MWSRESILRPWSGVQAASASVSGSHDRGVVLGGLIALLVLALSLSGSVAPWAFIDIPSCALVFGGTLAVTLLQYSPNILKDTVHALQRALRASTESPTQHIVRLVQLSKTVRIQGPLYLESAARDESDPVLRRGMQLAVDGQSQDEVRRLLELEQRLLAEQEGKAVQVLESAGQSAPAMGLIGTVLGLIQMMDHMGNQAQLGQSMSLALLTTLYGAVLAHGLLLPLAGKLRARLDQQLHMRAMSIEAIGALMRDENPLSLEQRLLSFLPVQG